MLKLNWGLLVCGVVGAIVVIALPLAEVAGIKVKLLDAGGQGFLTLGALLVGGGMGALNLFKSPARWSGGVAIVAFLLAAMKLRGGNASGGTGGMILAFVGFLLAIAVTVKPGTKA